MLITTSRKEEIYVRGLPTLHQLLYRGLPQHRRSMKRGTAFTLHVSRLAKDLKITPQAIYRWLDTNDLPPTWAFKLQTVTGSTLTVEQLQPFARLD